MGLKTQQVEDDEWPLVVIRPATFATNASLTALSDELGRLLRLGKQLCIIADLSHKTSLELAEVRELAELFRGHEQRIDDQVLALAMVAPSAMVRGGLKLVFKEHTPNVPLAVVRTRREAKRFVGPYLAELTTSVSTCMMRLAAVGH